MATKDPPILPPKDPKDWPAWLAELAKAGAKLGFAGRMCHDCACKFPQPVNEAYTQAVEDAVFQIAWDGGFQCHSQETHEPTGTPCIGFWYAKVFILSKKPDNEG